MPRKSTTEPRQKKNFWLPVELNEKLRQSAFTRRVSEAAIVREALEAHFKRKGRKDGRSVDAGSSLDTEVRP